MENTTQFILDEVQSIITNLSLPISSEHFLQIPTNPIIPWNEISKLQLSDEFLEEFKDHINWRKYIKFAPVINDQTIEKFENYINLFTLFQNRELSPEFVEKNYYKIFDTIAATQELKDSSQELNNASKDDDLEDYELSPEEYLESQNKLNEHLKNYNKDVLNSIQGVTLIDSSFIEYLKLLEDDVVPEYNDNTILNKPTRPPANKKLQKLLKDPNYIKHLIKHRKDTIQATKNLLNVTNNVISEETINKSKQAIQTLLKQIETLNTKSINNISINANIKLSNSIGFIITNNELEYYNNSETKKIKNPNINTKSKMDDLLDLIEEQDLMTSKTPTPQEDPLEPTKQQNNQQPLETLSKLINNIDQKSLTSLINILSNLQTK
jgi:hypothetical protein